MNSLNSPNYHIIKDIITLFKEKYITLNNLIEDFILNKGHL